VLIYSKTTDLIILSKIFNLSINLTSSYLITSKVVKVEIKKFKSNPGNVNVS
jgi:hypothetical protein